MKDQLEKHVEPEETISEALKSVVQKIEVNANFKAELGKQLVEAHQPVRPGFGQSVLGRAMPAFGWVFALALMALVLNWMFRSIAPPPIPAAQETSISLHKRHPPPSRLNSQLLLQTAKVTTGAAKLYLAQSLPPSPAEANVYLKKITEQATRENVLALAQRFEINGEIQEVPGDIPGETNYRISDGRERLEVRSDRYFTYHSNFGEQLYLDNLSEGQARIIADNFLKKHDFDFEYKLESAPDMQGTQFYILPLTPDGYKMRFDYMQPVRYQIFLDSTGENIIFTGYPIEYESVGTFGIITIEDALQKILNPNPQSGLMEIFHGQGGGGGGSSFHKLNLSGTPVPFPSPTAQPQTNEGTVEYIVQEGDTVLGIAQDYGITPEKIVQANSWLSDGHVLTPGKTLIIPIAQTNLGSSEYMVQENDTLSSIALNFGITVDELLQANSITDPIIFTGQTLIIPGPNGNPNQPPIGRRYEGQRGIITVSIFNKPDGSQRSEYYLAINNHDGLYPYVILEGNGLEQLQAQHNHPIEIWGNVVRYNEQYNMPVVQVERFEIPFPDLQFQIIKGIAKPTELQGQTVILFTADNGITYVQMLNNGDIDTNIINDGSEYAMILEALIIPDEMYGNYPTLRIYNSAQVISPKNGQPIELTITSDQPYIGDELVISTEVYIPPSATIEKVELVYYIPDPRYALPDPNSGPQYIQPAWRFYGHYSNGDEFEILVQALKEEYLLPELAPYTPPG